MRLVTNTELTRTSTRLVFSASERAILRRASLIADAARELCSAHVGYDWELEDTDTFLAHISIGVDELIDGFEVDSVPVGLLG